MAKGKPQYRTLVNALVKLRDAIVEAHGPVSANDLGDRMDRVQRAVNQADDIIARAVVALERRKHDD